MKKASLHWSFTTRLLIKCLQAHSLPRFTLFIREHVICFLLFRVFFVKPSRKRSFSVLQFTSQNLDDHVGALSVVCVVLCLSTILLICLPWLASLRRCRGALALFVWGTLYVTAIVFIFTGGPVTAWEQVRRKQKENKKKRVLSAEDEPFLTSFLTFSGSIFPLPLCKCVHRAAPLSGLGPDGWDRDQCFTHHHHQHICLRHQPWDTRPGCSGKRLEHLNISKTISNGTNATISVQSWHLSQFSF